ncbi:arginyltransferase [Vibrio ulleungensis]|uniref:Aspartate/glutamate leucyltransferase n=1 Tax=Vibrio ulleungensis TaxID=2807619 RepID=A0ABS2HIK2_9VIBR|nr:arginyltransferase [Vibrio ulleungensis]MBM7036844.1 arginyltransferase [Vibrio ulleungensis]
MTSELKQIQIGYTENHPCSYLENQLERIAIAMDDSMHNNAGYEVLLANGFRRSGKTIYMPHCDQCQECQAIRIPVKDFVPSRSQKRLLNKAKHLQLVVARKLDEQWFTLYERYIEAKHPTGSMYPANQRNFEQFIESHGISTRFLHIYDDKELIAVAVTDTLSKSASAFYTFYQPNYAISLGTLSVLLQIKYCNIKELDWLYLGYQIDACQAMNYKVKFNPHQRLVNRRWQG